MGQSDHALIRLPSAHSPEILEENTCNFVLLLVFSLKPFVNFSFSNQWKTQMLWLGRWSAWLFRFGDSFGGKDVPFEETLLDELF